MTKKDGSDSPALANSAATTTALAAPLQHDGMTGEFDQGDMRLPTCSIVQPMSKDKGPENHYWFEPEGRSAESFTAIVLNIIGTAAMWEPIGSEVKGPICKSMDRVMGMTTKPSVVLQEKMEDSLLYIECKRCPHHADWEVLKSGPMHCSKGFTLLMLDIETEQPFLYYVKGTQFTPVKNRIVSPALLRRQRYGTAEPWLTPFTWTIRLVDNPGRKYYVPVIEMGKPFEPEQRTRYAELSASLAGRAEQQAVEEMAEETLEQSELNLG